MKRPRFVIIQAKDGFRWRLMAANGRIVATGEAHTRKADAHRAMMRVAELAFEAANR